MTPEERMELLHPEKECKNPECRKKFRVKRGRDAYCSSECRRNDQARAQRERRRKEKEEAEAFKRGDGRAQPKISLARMDELCRIYGMSYGKLEDAIRNGKIYVE